MCYASCGATTNAFNGTTNTITNAFAAFSALSRAAVSNEPKRKNNQAGGLSSFQLASMDGNSNNFGSSVPSMHSYMTSNSYAQPSMESPYIQPNNYNSFGSSVPVNFLQQQAINQAFQSHMLNPFLFNQQQSSGFGSYVEAKKHKN